MAEGNEIRPDIPQSNERMRNPRVCLLGKHAPELSWPTEEGRVATWDARGGAWRNGGVGTNVGNCRVRSGGVVALLREQ